MSSERVAMDLVAASQLVRAYRGAAGDVGAAATMLFPHLRQAADLLVEPTNSAATILEGTAIELAYDADDLAWRVDYIRDTDTRFTAGLLRIGFLPHRRGVAPLYSATALASLFSELIDRVGVLVEDDLGALLDGLRAYSRSDAGDAEWDEIRDYWAGDLVEDDHRLARKLADVVEALADLDGTDLADAFDLLRSLTSQLHDPAYLAEFFMALGAVQTLELTEAISTLAYADALSASGKRPEFSVDPTRLRDMLSTALGVASQSTFSARHHGVADSLPDQWFDELFDAAIMKDDRLFGRDPIHVHDGLPALFAAGRFRAEVAVRAGEVALDIFDHHIDVRRGRASPLYDGFDILATHWEDRGGLLLSAATRYPSVAASLLLHEASTGRTGAQIVADRSFDNMNRDVVARHFAEFARAGTITAEDYALESGVGARALRLVGTPWLAKAAVFEAIAHHGETETKEDPYPTPLNETFSDVLIHTMPHMMQVPPHEVAGLGVYVDRDADPGDVERIPSGHAGISVPPFTAKNLLGSLFRHEADRARITAAANFEQRRSYALDPSLLTLEQVGRLEGALVNGYIVSGIDNADQIAREMEEANSFVDNLWAGGQFVAELIPGSTVVTKGVEVGEILLGLGGVDPLEDYVHGDPSGDQIAARNEGREEVFDVDRRAREFVFAEAFDRLRLEYSSVWPGGLSDRSQAILEYMSDDSQLGRLINADTESVGSPPRNDIDAKAEFDSMAWHFTRTDPGLFLRFERLKLGLDEAHPELAFD